MGKKSMTVPLDAAGVDAVSQAVQGWLKSAGEKRENIIHIRLAVEELLGRAAEHFRGGSVPDVTAKFRRGYGAGRLLIRYAGGRYDPTPASGNEFEEWTAQLLARTGYQPGWRYRGGANELLLRLPGAGLRPELMLLAAVAAALLLGLLGLAIPEPVRAAANDYCLSFLSTAFLNLINTFIGFMIFLSVALGICGIGSAGSFGRIGKMVVSRFLCISFVFCGIAVFLSSLFFHPAGTAAEGAGSQFHALLEMLFGILPSNPISPFLERNTLQIVFLAAVAGMVLLLTGSRTEGLRSVMQQASEAVMRTVAAICTLLPLYIFTSLLQQFWSSGASQFLRLWKPLVFCALLALSTVAVYLLYVCRKLKVPVSVLGPKLVPDFLIGLTTASSSVAMSLSMEINTKKLGISPELSGTAVPIGVILFGCPFALLYITVGVYLAETYGVSANLAWWITLWLLCMILYLASPPVAGSTISCVTILLNQFGLPMECLSIGLTLSMLLDFICTGCRIPVLHLELLLQADRLEMLDREILRKKN